MIYSLELLTFDILLAMGDRFIARPAKTALRDRTFVMSAISDMR